MEVQDNRPDNATASDEITLVMYLPECGWITLICIPRAKLGELCLTPVQWLRYFGSNAYGADGDIFSQVYSDANEDEIMADMLSEEEEEEEPAVDVNKDETMTDVRSEEEEEEPAVEENHGESGKGPAPKICDQSAGRDFACKESGTGLGLHSLHEQVPNRFLSKEDIDLTPKSRFKDGKPYSDLLRREEGSHNDSQSELSPTHPRFRSDEEFQPPPSSSEQDTPVQIPSERLRDIEKKATVKAQRKQEEEKAAVKAAEQALVHLTSGRGYAKFRKPTEEPFNDESQLVLQYFVTGRDGVSAADERTIPHNTPALLREGTRLSVAASHAAYTCAVWRAFSPNTTNSVLTPRIPRFDHYGLQRSGSTSGKGSSSRTASTSTSASHSHSHSHIFAGQQQQQGKRGWDERDERDWDLLLGWSIPSVVARHKAEMRRARAIEREARKAKVIQWNSTIVR
ncbi:hypothetical protein DFH09DRAFT_1155299 [Mycena vulgaris]|nr:hypothetical protein DFH09DRAFT_1155299 [Mycena vulgaris]